jgi:prepilin-type N-terminal cleavage/methylation domain-containing protein
VSSLRSESTCLRDEHGFTLIELLVSMLVATVITGAAMSFLIFTTEDVSHITARVGVDQSGRVVLAKVMSNLDSGCYKTSAAPVQAGSGENTLVFESESGSQSYFPSIEKHEVVFAKGTGTTEGTLTEKNYTSIGTKQVLGETVYEFATTPTSTVRLLKGVKQTQYGSEKAVPVFSYYRYYHENDPPPQGDTMPPYGEIDPTPINVETKSLTAAEALDITKVTMSFTLAPEGKEAVSFNHDRPVALEDSTILRLAPSSEAASNPNLPCSEKT